MWRARKKRCIFFQLNSLPSGRVILLLAWVQIGTGCESKCHLVDKFYSRWPVIPVNPSCIAEFANAGLDSSSTGQHRVGKDLSKSVPQCLLFLEYENLREFFPGTVDPLDSHRHRVAAMGKYGLPAGSIGACGIHPLVRNGVGVDLLYRNGVKWRVACDRNLRAVALGRVTCVEGNVSG